MLHPDALAVVDTAARSGEADIFSTGLWHITPDGVEVEVRASLDYTPHRGLYLNDPELTGETPYLFQLTAMKRSVWERYPYYSGGPGGDDLDFILHHLLHARFRKIPQALYGQRRVGDGFSDRARRGRGHCSCPCSERYRTRYYTRLLESAGEDRARNFGGDIRWSGG